MCSRTVASNNADTIGALLATLHLLPSSARAETLEMVAKMASDLAVEVQVLAQQARSLEH